MIKPDNRVVCVSHALLAKRRKLIQRDHEAEKVLKAGIKNASIYIKIPRTSAITDVFGDEIAEGRKYGSEGQRNKIASDHITSVEL